MIAPTVLDDGLAYSVSCFDAEFHGQTRAQTIVAVSFRGRRPSDWQCKRALRLAGVPETAEEDNHFPGVTRSFFHVPGVDPELQCECKSDETTVVEPDGFTWSAPTSKGRVE